MIFSEADIFQIDTQCQKYDFALCLGLIAHTGRLNELFNVIHNVLREDGKLLLQSAMKESPGATMTRLLTNKRYTRNQGYNISYFSHTDIIKAAGNAGFKILEFRRYGAGFVFLDRIWSQFNYWIEKLVDKFHIGRGSECVYLLIKK